MCEYQVFNEKFGLLPECKYTDKPCTLCVFGNKETYVQAKKAEKALKERSKQ